MAKCKNCKHFYKRPDITMFTCAEGKPHEDNTVIDYENYAPMTRADEIRSMTDEELALALLYVLRKLKKVRKNMIMEENNND